MKVLQKKNMKSQSHSRGKRWIAIVIQNAILVTIEKNRLNAVWLIENLFNGTISSRIGHILNYSIAILKQEGEKNTTLVEIEEKSRGRLRREMKIIKRGLDIKIFLT